MFFRGFTFLYPQAVWMFFLLPLIFGMLFLRFLWRRSVAQRLGDPIPLYRSFGKRVLLVSCAWLFLLLAILYPEGYPHPAREAPLSRKTLPETQEVLFLLDTSASMGVQDTETGLTRLQEAKRFIREMVARTRGENVSLYAFSSTLLPLVPPTTDTLFFSLVLDDVTLQEGGVVGTDFGRVVEQLADVLEEQSQQTVVFLFSDGEDPQLEELPQERRREAVEALADLMPSPSAFSYQLNTIGMGTKEGAIVPNTFWQGEEVRSRRNDVVLEVLAKKGDGTFWQADTVSPSAVAREGEDRLEGKRRFVRIETGKSLVEGTAYFSIPAGISLFLFLLL